MNSRQLPRETVFHYPFEGRPRPLPRVGLFVFSPEVYLKLSGISLQAVFAENGHEPLYRRMQRSLNGETKPTTMQKVIDDLIDKLHLDNNDVFKKISDGDKVTIDQFENLSFFEACFLGMRLSPEDYGLHHWFSILLEQVGTAALRKVLAGDISGAARRIAEHPLLHHLLWPKALAAFEQAPTADALGPIRVSMTLEAHLAWLAAWDRKLASVATSDSSPFICLIPSKKQPGRNPTSLFYAELQRRLGAQSIGDVLSTPSGSLSGLEQWTLNRWSAGTHFPDIESIAKLLLAYGLDEPSEILCSQLIFSKHLHLLGYLAQKISRHAHQVGKEKGQVLWPWPLYPFGYSSFEEWTSVRYPHWLTIFAEHGRELPALVRSL